MRYTTRTATGISTLRAIPVRPRRTRTALLTLVAAVVVGWAGATASAAAPPGDVIFSTTNDGTAFAKIDPSTATSTVLGSSGFSQDWAAALDTDGTLWTTINGFGSAQIAKVDKTTGHATPVGAPIGTQMISLEIAANGTMYGIGIGDTRLYRIDKTTGVGTPIGTGTGINFTMDIAFDCHGQLWATTNGGLWTVDTTTGGSTFRASITGVSEGAFSVMGLVFDRACQMLVTTYSSPGTLYAVDPLTGAASRIGSTGLFFPHGGDIAAFSPTSKAECKNGGWRNFLQFKNQGDCVSFVATGGKNPPANNQPAPTM
jgi:hypothetical protein